MRILTAGEKGASTQSGKGCGLSVSCPELTGPVFRSKEATFPRKAVNVRSAREASSLDFSS